MTQQTITWVALPNGVSEAGHPRLSVFISPRLQIDGGTTTLAAFEDLRDWPSRVEQLRLEIRDRSGQLQTQIHDGFTASSEHWKALFPPTTLVKSFTPRHLHGMTVISYPASALETHIHASYADMASTHPTAVPARSQLSQERIARFEFPSPRAQTAGADLGAYVGSLTARRPSYPLEPSSELALAQALRFQRQAPAEPPPAEPPDIEFHDIIAALGHYPALMRLLGLVLDLELVDRNVSITNERYAEISVRPLGWECPVGPPCHRSPLTRTGKNVQALPRGANRDLVDGNLALGNGHFAVVQLDLEDASAKLAQRADALFGPDSDTAGQPEPSAALPALQSAGIAIIHTDRAAATAAMLARQEEIEIAADPPTVLYADDLVRGYRLRLRKDNSATPTYPCRRREQHRIQKPDGGVIQFDVPVADAWASSAVAVDRARAQLFLQETLVRWEGWALCAPRPDSIVPQTERPGSSPPPSVPASKRLPFETTLSVLPRTIPSLRYGSTYRLGLEIADLAGNGPVVSHFDRRLFSLETTYRRYAPILPPLLVRTHPLTAESAPGEAIDRLVIRSHNIDVDDRDVVTMGGAERHLAAPRMDWLGASIHGVFDSMSDQAAYDLIDKRNGSFPADATGTAPIVPVQELRADGSLELPYLPDPLATRIVLTNVPGLRPGLTAEVGPDGILRVEENPPMLAGDPPTLIIDTENPASWADPRSIRLRLVAGASMPHWDASQRILTLSVPMGRTHAVQISSAPNSGDRSLAGIMALPHLLTQQPDPVAAHTFQRIAERGGSWLVTPPQQVLLVHASRQPLGSIRCQDLKIERLTGRTAGRLTGVVHCDWESTGELEIVAQSEEWVDAGENPDVSFTRTDSVIAFSLPTDATGAPGTIDLSRLPGMERAEGGYDPVLHNFEDTRARTVHYRAVGVTRFAEFFPSNLANLTRTSDPFTLQVPSTAPPKPPVIRSVIPTFSWVEREETAGGVWKRSRDLENGTLRVSLERPWFSSGGDERLAVITLPAGMRATPEMRAQVSLAGKDPMWETYFGPSDLHGPPYAIHYPWAVAAEIQEIELTGQPGKFVNVIPHAVQFDARKNCWYADIRIDLSGYRPFLRLALARFQPNAISGAGFDFRLSPIVICDPIQTNTAHQLALEVYPAFPNELLFTVGTAISPASRSDDQGNNVIPTSSRDIELQRRDESIADEDLGWVTVQPLSLISGQTFGRLPWPRNGRYRILVRQYELLWGDDTGTPETPIQDYPRLIYANAIEIPPPPS